MPGAFNLSSPYPLDFWMSCAEAALTVDSSTVAMANGGFPRPFARPTLATRGSRCWSIARAIVQESSLRVPKGSAAVHEHRRGKCVRRRGVAMSSGGPTCDRTSSNRLEFA